MSRIRAVVFDVGGTLIYPAEPVGETYARLARPHGFELEPTATTAAFRSAFGRASPRPPSSIPRDGDDRAWWRRIVVESLPEASLADTAGFAAFFEEAYLYFARPQAWGLFPEVTEVLEVLRSYPLELVVLSNWDGRLHAVLDGCGLGEYFPRRFISAELGWEKPDRALFEHVAESLQLPAGTLLNAGDDQVNDVDGARRAGWQAALIDRPRTDLWAVVEAVQGKG